VASATFKLVRQVKQVGCLAEVTVTAMLTRGSATQVLVEVYGPEAWEWPVCPDWRVAAAEGVRFALEHSDAPSGAKVVVDMLRCHPVRTTNTPFVVRRRMRCGRPSTSRGLSSAGDLPGNIVSLRGMYW